jgi:hypothetical protein
MYLRICEYVCVCSCVVVSVYVFMCEDNDSTILEHPLIFSSNVYMTKLNPITSAQNNTTTGKEVNH